MIDLVIDKTSLLLKSIYLKRYRYIRYNPLKIHYVDPKKIQYLTGTEWVGPTDFNYENRPEFIPEFDKKKHRRQTKVPIGAVLDGDWDRSDTKFSDLTVYRGLRQRFENERHWSETTLYKNHEERILNGQTSYGCKSLSCLETKLEQIDDLFYNIKTNGYASQNELGGSIFDEITVNICRDGRILFNKNGRHRLSIAKILDIDSIPVFTMVRHENLITP